LDPLRYFYYSLAATAALSAGQHERALTLAKESLRANRTHTSTWRVMAISQVQMGQLDEARASAAELLRLQPGLTVSSYLSRHPSGRYGTGQMWADAMRQAGVPV
jgi:tetratricopeptide (TPR) repeat protein